MGDISPVGRRQKRVLREGDGGEGRGREGGREKTSALNPVFVVQQNSGLPP